MLVLGAWLPQNHKLQATGPDKPKLKLGEGQMLSERSYSVDLKGLLFPPLQKIIQLENGMTSFAQGRIPTFL